MKHQDCRFNGLSWEIENPSMYEDCRDALARIEGGREYLKNYVPKEEGEGFNFDDPIGRQINLSSLHSGSSYYSMLWTYRQLLNDWDGWVLAKKERAAYEEYETVQVEAPTIHWLHRETTASIRGEPGTWMPADKLLKKALDMGLYVTSLQELHEILEQIHTENLARQKLLQLQHKKRVHDTLIGGLKWKYKHPERWFDTEYGSTITPTRPSEITAEALDEMEATYPGYTQHIQRVRGALASLRFPDGVRRFSPAGEEHLSNHLLRHEVKQN